MSSFFYRNKKIKQLFFNKVYGIIENIKIKEKISMKEVTYRIYADESVSDGKFFSNFYGLCLSKSI